MKQARVRVVALAAGLIATLLVPPGTRRVAHAQGPGAAAKPAFSQAARFGVSGAARDLPLVQAPTGLGAERPTGPFRELPKASVPVTGAVTPDAALQPSASAPAPAMPGPMASFDGLSSQANADAFGFRVLPPDTNGDVGPSHYVQQTNLLVRVFDKTGGALTAPFKLSTLFAPLGGICSTDDDGDPIVLYDPLADRWLLSQFAFASSSAPPYHQCIAVSQTSNPTGAYFLYDFVVPGNEFPDYPKLGVWPDGYYMTTNQFFNGALFDGAGAFAFDRKKMLAGDASAGMIYFNLNLASHPEGIGGMLPSDFDGLNAPPSGAPNVFAYFLANEFGDPSDGLRVFDFRADFGNPAASTFTERPESPIGVAAFNPLSPSGNDDIRQPPPATDITALDAIGDRLMHRLQYRNLGTHESLVANHTVNVGTGTTLATYRAGVRYYELRRSGGGFAVNEQATFAPDSDNRWMGSAAMDNRGDLAVGYSVASLATFPSIRYAGRLAGDPPGGLFQGEATLVAGTGVQTSTASRWGDYSALAVDPVDDCTFWYTTEYYTLASQQTSTAGWLTRIGSFKFTDCQPPDQGMLQGVVTDLLTGTPIAGAVVGASNGFQRSSNGAGQYSMALVPGSYSATASAPGYQPVTTPGIIVTNGATVVSDFRLLAVGAQAATYDFWVSRSFDGPPSVPFHDCATFTQNRMFLASCGDSGPLIETLLFNQPSTKQWIGLVPCGGLDLVFVGTFLQGSLLPGAVDIRGGWGVGRTQGTTFGVEGTRNDACVPGGASPYAR